MTKKNKKDDNNTDKVIKIILIIIIIFLLLHNCSLLKDKENIKINIIDISCKNDKCKQLTEVKTVNCIEDINNSKCLIPDFVGETKKDVLKWLDSISNTIEMEIKTVESKEHNDGYVLEQSVSNISVKELLDGKTKLVITIVNNGSLVDCSKDSKNSKCVLQNFVGKSKNDVDNWLDGFSNNIKIKYIYMTSNNKKGTIINQSIKGGTSVKDILDNDNTVIIYISTGDTVVYSDTISKNNNIINNNGGNNNNQNNNNNNNNNDNNTNPDEEEQEELEDDFYVVDKEKIKWEEESELNIFEDSLSISKVRGKIAPESTGTYKFIVNNGTIYNTLYKITFSENNLSNMNMKYKLKKGNTYLVNHYVSFDELNLENVYLSSRSSDTYYLEWKWVGDNDDNDTRIGKSAQNNEIIYNLKIDIEVESV